MKAINELGNIYNNLQVVGESPQKGRKHWICRCCKCGEEYVYPGSVLRAGKAKCDKCKYIGRQYGELTVIANEYVASDRHLHVRCKCSCGREDVFVTTELTNGKYTKCRKCNRIRQYIDETGNQYGRLTVLEYAGNNTNGHALWKCKCECGNIVTVRGYALRNGTTSSCGCLSSLGENKIATLLKEHNILFKTQIRFPDCKDVQQLRFDFGIYDANGALQYLIEYDGIQHFFSVKNGWNTPEILKATQKRDQIKNQYCQKNHIPLIRIPYNKYNELEIKDLILESSDYICQKDEWKNTIFTASIAESEL